LLALTEAAIRQAGLADVPVYRLDDRYGYVPQANQSGAFLRTHHWVFNDRHMGAEEAWAPSTRANLLLIGNSIVMGGNSYDQKDKVGPLLQSSLGPGCRVWPIAAGAWSTVNEVRFLQASPDVVAATDFFVWEIMAGQMDGVHPWRGETQHPTRRPWWAAGYVARKALVQRFGLEGSTSPTTLPSEIERHYAEFEQILARLTSAAARRPAGMLFLYPDQQQLELARTGREWMDDRQRLEQLAARHGVLLLDVARSPHWTSAMYKDGVHPTTEGNRALAAVLADALGGAGVTATCADRSVPQARTPLAGTQ
jgi:hypothetical protein